jgi:glycine cleavage system H protein
MINIPPDLKYGKTHEWLRSLPDGSIEVGITDHAQEALGDLISVEVPKLGRRVVEGEAYAVVESVKTASDIHSPISGVVTAANALLANSPDLINTDPYGAGWIVRMRPGETTASHLLSAAEYAMELATEHD